VEVPPFFVPTALPEKQEEVYADFAQWCRRAVPPQGKRIYSITYYHDGDEWTATVGETLKGTRQRTSRLGSVSQARLRDPATVLAIFPGDPYLVVTDSRFSPGVVSRWGNPFMAGRPVSVTHFLEQ